MRPTLPLLAAVLLFLGGAASSPTVARAGEVPAFPPEEALRFLLGRPARAHVVQDLDPRALAGDPVVRARWARALGEAGGVATWPRLLRLTRDRDPQVRAAAAEALASSSAWGGMPEDYLVRMLGGRTESDAVAAARALGAVGTAHALPDLLDAARTGARPVARAAFAALRQLTGEDRGTSAARWAAWWKLARPRLRDQLEVALDVVTEDPEAPAADRARQQVIRLAWVDPERLASRCGTWLDAWDRDLHRHAALVVRARPMPRLLVEIQKREARAREGSADQRTLRETLRVLGLQTH